MVKHVKDRGMEKGIKAVFGLSFKIITVVVLTILLLEAGVRVVLSVSLNNYLTKTLPQPYGSIMRAVGQFDCFDAKSVNQFDPICYYIPRAGFFRGPHGRMDVPKEKGPGEIRIICIGDSTTYCLGADYYRSWVYLLGKALIEKYPHKNIQVLNAGLPGSTQRQIKRIFQFHLTAYHPDVLIWRGGSTRSNRSAVSDTYFVNIRLDVLRTFVWRCLYESRIFRVICVLLDKGGRQRSPADVVYDFIMNRNGYRSPAQEPSLKFDSDFAMVKKIAEEHGVRHVLQAEYLSCDEKGVIVSELEGNNSPSCESTVHTLADFKEYAKKHPTEKLFIDNVHLTETGEAITAEEILKGIVDKKWIETLN